MSGNAADLLKGVQTVSGITLITKQVNADEWVKSVTPLIGGKGGGGDAAKLPEVFEAAKGNFG